MVSIGPKTLKYNKIFLKSWKNIILKLKGFLVNNISR